MGQLINRRQLLRIGALGGIGMLAVGILGGFTTFSTFGLDQVFMLLKAEYFKAFVYVAVSVVGGLALTGLGFFVGKGLH